MKKFLIYPMIFLLVFVNFVPVGAAYAEKTFAPVLVAYGDSIAAAGQWEAEFSMLSGETVINSGVGGDTSSDGLKRFASAVADKNPDVVFIGFGTNDTSIDMPRYVDMGTYADNLRAMIDKVRDCGAIPVLIIPAPIVDAPYLTRHDEAPFVPYGGPNGLLSLYAQTARDVAAEKQVTAADVNADFSAVDYENYISDGVHPNAQGYKLYAKTILGAYRNAVKGDVDGDNEVTVADYIITKRSIIGSISLAAAQKPRADVDGSGDTDAADYIIIKRCVLHNYDIDRGVPSKNEITPPEGVEYVTANLTANSRKTEDMAANTKELQACVDAMNASGGGAVLIPAGTYYFSSQGMNSRRIEDYVCMPKDNVLVMGAGRATVLMPVGNTNGGLDMFYYNEYADSGFKNPKYLINADFRDFVIDGGLAHCAHYTSAGKGFMFNLFKDCDFDNIVCKNTDGTGFGVDCPINCTITNCEAYGCGKAATTASYGASGFGIGTGYSEEETMIIDNCYAEGNKKFGFFFEHQGRFSKTAYTAQKLKNCVVSNCTAKNNFNDFGGELALDLTYINCRVPSDTTSVTPVAFRQHSIRCKLIDMHVEAEFSDVADKSKYYYEPVYWAVNAGITTGSGENKFGVDADMAKSQAITFLYRAAGMPGELILGNAPEGDFYADALAWALKNGIVDSAEGIKDPCTRGEFIRMLWKYSGSPDVAGSYDSASNWAMKIGLMDTYSETNILRCDAITLLYRYFQTVGA